MAKRLLLLLLLAAFVVQVGFAQQKGRITGIVTNEEGKPVPTADVSLIEIERKTTTDLEGKYSIKNVKTGGYTLKVRFVGYEVYEDQVTIEADEVLVKDVVLQAKKINYSHQFNTAQKNGLSFLFKKNYRAIN